MSHALSNVLLTAALATIDRGWPVFPLRANAKTPALHAEERCPRTGECGGGHHTPEQRATVDRAQVMRCWQSAPFNVGMAPGPAGLVVIDLDTPKSPEDTPPAEWSGMRDGMDVFCALCGRAGQPVPEETFTVLTGRGGVHLYFTAPEGRALRSSSGLLGWKVDTRAHGGYVVAPGSVVNNRPYTVIRDQPPIPLPAWLLGPLSPPPAPAPMSAAVLREHVRGAGPYTAAAVTGEVEKVQSAREGGRNAALYAAAYALARMVTLDTLTEDDVTAVLTAAGLSVGLTERECATAIRSGLLRGARGRVRAA
ncbi:bifunctional DNA primase/polymerase [Streptomyces sp. H10-C2]|uniref:bifunctional DNA primase/polymerase n=1 Tax=unclassified Streptomyces TaxID=2593676 RepID=UPI0024B9E030|nr:MULTISPECIES: bifunctional DNA primase/polymerase [unclassified Streptomyces]MDJ0341381.1 bifunctional DNA primase/polymerase [Streptomyces sp. PH10-H1]MDJ0370976.1 bifunctional DNA primase/polymerase [Streptomyces sp. H10-C2]